jgi:chemotaxis-related protein WspD
MAEEESSRELIQTDAEPSQQIDACWQRIGVWAANGATCPVLQDVIHCRNCPTYVQAGRRCLANQPLVDESAFTTSCRHAICNH